MNQPFVPAWAETTLGAKRDPAYELRLLRDFYTAWVEMHKVAADPKQREYAEFKAQRLVDCANAVDDFDNKKPNGHG